MLRRPHRLKTSLAEHLLPWITSLALHATLLAVGLLTYHSVKVLLHRQVQTAPADTPLVTATMTASLNEAFSGVENDVTRATIQDRIADSTANGASWDRGSGQASLRSFDANPNRDPAADPLIGIGPGMFKAQKGGRGAGESGGLAQFGMAPQSGGSPNIFRSGIMDGGRPARSVAFVCDASGSMLPKFDDLRRELSKAVQNLKPIQSFTIHFFSEGRPQSLSPNLLMASPENKLRALTFLGDVAPRGSTDPLPAIELAFKEHPQIVFLLTDGDFPDNAAVLTRVRQLNRDHRVKIYTIAFVGEQDTDTGFIALLKQVAHENGGAYRYVAQDELR